MNSCICPDTTSAPSAKRAHEHVPGALLNKHRCRGRVGFLTSWSVFPGHSPRRAALCKATSAINPQHLNSGCIEVGITGNSGAQILKQPVRCCPTVSGVWFCLHSGQRYAARALMLARVSRASSLPPATWRGFHLVWPSTLIQPCILLLRLHRVLCTSCVNLPGRPANPERNGLDPQLHSRKPTPIHDMPWRIYTQEYSTASCKVTAPTGLAMGRKI